METALGFHFTRITCYKTVKFETYICHILHILVNLGPMCILSEAHLLFNTSAVMPKQITESTECKHVPFSGY